jgi:catechol 2,3-dioxygenase-like lactoylglutathione lyase family enzyme
MWSATHNVRYHQTASKRLHHPTVGDLELDYEVMELCADSGLLVAIFSADPGSRSAEALDLLASWTRRPNRSRPRATPGARSAERAATPPSLPGSSVELVYVLAGGGPARSLVPRLRCVSGRLCDRTPSVTISRAVPNIKSDRPTETRAFFVELLGFEVAMDMGWVVTVVSPINPFVQVSIIGNDDMAAPGISVGVADVDAVHAKAVERGVEIVYPLRDEEWGVRRFMLREPSGTVVNVVSHRSD